VETPGAACPVPRTRHAETGSLAQLRVPYRHSDEWGVARREFGELEPSEFTDHMSLRATDVDAIREVLGELVFQRQQDVAPLNCRMSMDSSSSASAITGRADAISRTVKVMFVLTVSSQFAITIRA
jgi:hypothetical protein